MKTLAKINHLKIRLPLFYVIGVIFSLALSFIFSNDIFAAISDRRMNMFAQNDIQFYDDCSGSNGSSVAGKLSGNSNEEKIWNYLLEKGGITDAKALAGILGNLQAESSFNPFASNGTYYGIFQGNDTTWISQVESKTGYHWGEYDVSQDLQDIALEIELNYLVNWDRFNDFKADMSRVANQSPSSYAELWMVDVERAVYGSDSVEDSGVYQVMTDMYGGTVYQYQHLVERKQYAEALYAKYGSSSSSGSTSNPEGGSSSGSSNVINDKAIELAWEYGTSHAYNDPKPAYTAALAEVGATGDACALIGTSCDVFVATVLHASGYDTSIPFGAAPNLLDYLANHPDLYEEIPNNGDESELKPGDIRSRSGHIELYVQVDGVGRIASASHCDRTAEIKDYYDDTSYRIFRPKNVSSSSGNQSDSCSASSSASGLVSGGMTLEQAQAFMQSYHDEAVQECGGSIEACKSGAGSRATRTFDGALITGTGTYSAMNNCSAFSQWFSNRYTTAGGSGMNEVGIYQGSSTVSSLLSLSKGYTDGGKVPRVYAIFSTGPEEGVADGWWNHTGVVLGIDETNDKIIIGEASDSLSYFPQVSEHSLSEWTNNSSAYGPTYAWTDDIITLGR